MGKLVYFKWMVEDTKVLKENLTTEQIGELFIAVMDYLQTGIATEVSKEIRFPYADYRNRVDRACNSYNDICSKRAENGKKGGKAKAENAAKAAESRTTQKTKFDPPTLQQFKNAASRIAEDNDFGYVDSYDIEALFDNLKEENWNFAGMPIQSRKDWEKIIYARFHDPMSNYYDGMDRLNVSYYELFRYLVRKYPQMHHSWNDMDEIISSFFEEWDNDHFDIDGRRFEQSEWRPALEGLVAEWLEDTPA